MKGWVLLLFLTFSIAGALLFPHILRWIMIIAGVALFLFCLAYVHLDEKGKLL